MRMDGSAPTLSRRSGTGRRRDFIGDGGVLELVLAELSSGSELESGMVLYSGRGWSMRSGPHTVDNADKKIDSDEIRTRAGNPSRYLVKT